MEIKNVNDLNLLNKALYSKNPIYKYIYRFKGKLQILLAKFKNLFRKK